MTSPHPDSILIIDFGSQVTQLIARRVREAGVYSEIVPFQSAGEAFERIKPKGVILSGGPASTHRGRQPARPADRVRGGHSGARHLLWPDGHVRADGRRGRRLGSSRIRPRLCRDRKGLPAVRRHLGDGTAPPGLDEPWRPGHLAAARASRFSASRKARPSPIFGDVERKMYGVHVPPRSGPHAGRRKTAANFVHKIVGLESRLVDGRLSRIRRSRRSASRSARAR